jgi:pantoate--beta-alanine ligase
MVTDDGITDAEAVRKAVRQAVVASPVQGSGAGGEGMMDAAIAIDYVSSSDEQTLEEVDTIDRPALILVAARIGTTRLIDNTIVVPEGMPVPPDLQALMAPP